MEISLDEQLTLILSIEFAKSMMTNPTEFLSDEDICGEEIYDLSIRSMKELLYKVIAKMIYEGYDKEQIFKAIDKISKQNIYKMIPEYEKRKIISGARSLVLERKDDENE